MDENQQVQEKRKIKTPAFMLKFVDSSNTATLLTIRESGYAEGILRGLVHSGFEVSIKEIEIEVEVEDYEKCTVDYDRPMMNPVGRLGRC